MFMPYFEVLWAWKNGIARHASALMIDKYQWLRLWLWGSMQGYINGSMDSILHAAFAHGLTIFILVTSLGHVRSVNWITLIFMPLVRSTEHCCATQWNIIRNARIFNSNNNLSPRSERFTFADLVIKPRRLGTFAHQLKNEISIPSKLIVLFA